jgi:hypothetical protein
MTWERENAESYWKGRDVIYFRKISSTMIEICKAF